MTDPRRGASNQRDVEFTAGGVVLRGWLRTPETTAPYPLVILAHGLGGLKEWTIPDVASALVDAGIVAMAFDYRNFGDSDGLPREEIDHCGQIEDCEIGAYLASAREIEKVNGVFCNDRMQIVPFHCKNNQVLRRLMSLVLFFERVYLYSPYLRAIACYHENKSPDDLASDGSKQSDCSKCSCSVYTSPNYHPFEFHGLHCMSL